MNKPVVFLMYHELQSDNSQLCDDSPGYVRYVVDRDTFRIQLSFLKTGEWQGWNVTQALQALDKTNGGVCITFDDGCASDLIFAAPFLKEHGFNATFYVTVNHLGLRGYLTESQLRELADLGFEIGSHSLNHSYLPQLSEEDLRRELFQSKERLEQITGRQVLHFSCPGGRTSHRIAQVAREAGYDSVATSRIGANRIETDRFALMRIPVMHNTSLPEFERICKAEGLGMRQAEKLLLGTAKQVLGNTIYDRVRSVILGGKAD